LAERASQRLDELSDRLRRGLADRAALARGTLVAQSVRLSAPLLRANLKHARERLATLERVMRSLDPDAVLQRGFARVTDVGGRTLTSAASAGKEPALTVRFRDGSLDVVPAGSAPRPPRARPITSPKPAAAEQPKLL
jgi:exodeoxyribonuclease VII large subunit